MQLYNVKFRNHKANVIDVGEVLVVASSNEAASETVLSLLELPKSSTTFEVVRVKPNLFQVMRGEIPKEMPINGTFPRSQAALDRLTEPDRDRYSVQISGAVWAHSEDSAVKKLARYALAEMDGEAKKPHAKAVGMVQILSDKMVESSASAVERNGIYSNHRFFHGGDARGS